MTNVVALPPRPPVCHDTAKQDGELFALCEDCERQALDAPRVVTVSRRLIDGITFDEYRCKACHLVVERRRAEQSEHSKP